MNPLGDVSTLLDRKTVVYKGLKVESDSICREAN